MRPVLADPDFDAAFVSLYPRAVEVGVRLLRDRSGAEDVAAEALARAYARWSTLKAAPYRDAWVLRVTANLAIDVLRRRPRGQHRGQHVGEAALVEQVALARAVARLPRRQREVVVLRYLVDLSELDAASVLGVAPGTVKSHLHRALVALRRDLGADFEETHGVVI